MEENDLISRSALETKAKTIYMEFENVAVPSRVIPLSDLHLAPAVDAEPVKYGEFTTLDEVNTFVTAFPKRCETCGTEFILLFRKSEPNQGMFCPRCGARRRDERA